MDPETNNDWKSVLTSVESKEIKKLIERFSKTFGITLHVAIENENIYISHGAMAKKYILLKTNRPVRIRNFESEIIPCYMILDSIGCCITASITLKKILTSLFSIFIAEWMEAVLEPNWSPLDDIGNRNDEIC